MGGNNNTLEGKVENAGFTAKLSEINTKIRGHFGKNKENIEIPSYDPEVHGSLIEYEVPEGYVEIDRYWLDEPYAFASIIEKNGINYYHVVEPSLTTYEKEILERAYEDLQDILTIKNERDGANKEKILKNEAISLFRCYHATFGTPSMEKIIYYLRRNFLNYERISPLMLDPYIEDISCDGVDIPVFLYHIKYRNIMTNISFKEDKLNSLVIKLCQKSGKHISVGEPIVDATMPDGSRLQSTLGREITTRGSSFTIRKFKGDPITPIDLMRYNTCNLEMMTYFWLAIENGNSAIFAGGTASGKTAMLNAVSLFIPPLSKVISIEDTRELMLHHDNWIAGLTRKSLRAGGGAGEVSMYDLLKAALRQRPEAILVGEVRGSEALTLFQALSTGHNTYSTMHAGDVQTVVNRLESEPINVPHVMLQALDILCIQSQTFVDSKRVRRTNSLVEFTGLDPKTGSIRINELYRWDAMEDKFLKFGNSHVMKDVMQKRGWDSKKLQEEIQNRNRILEYMYDNNIRDYISVSIIVQAYSINPDTVLDAIDKGTLQEIISLSL